MDKLREAARQVVDAWDLGEFSTRMDEAITALRKALSEQAEQEPVAWGCKTIEDFLIFQNEKQANLFAVKWELKVTPLYAAPVRTKDLTDDEIAAVTGYRKSGATWPVVEEVARAVIAADREKNK